MTIKYFDYEIPKKKKGENSLNSLKKSKEKIVLPHPLYGEIPAAQGMYTTKHGNVISSGFYYPDPNYVPSLPPGAIRGNVGLQEFCPIHHFPKYFYVDEEVECVQCRDKFVFFAGEQKFWYESLKFNFHSHAINCQACRKQNRSQKKIIKQLQKAYEIYEANLKDPVAMLALAQAICLQYEITKKGNLNLAISLARKAQKCAPELIEYLFWEARAQAFLDRPNKAKQLLEEFFSRAKLK
ncbi:MAG: zinc-ribbon domain containing protein [Parachlamydiaceae bacterium]|nr:zinc-ribbon domain containing protein [Parachlamydiaceae bacterium]